MLLAHHLGQRVRAQALGQRLVGGQGRCATGRPQGRQTNQWLWQGYGA
jgi:hypothetical protein